MINPGDSGITMTVLRSKSTRHLRGLTLLGGLILMAIPLVLILSGAVFVVVLMGSGCLAGGVVWKKVTGKNIQQYKQRKGG
jgi:hypothetical protein